MRAVALDRVAYFGEHLTNNIASSPEGYLICRNAVIARTGYQTYKVSELADPEGLLRQQYSPMDEIEIWRDPKEVFAPATLASFEGKVFTLTHPPELLDPDNTHIHDQGHVQNVRQGYEPLEDGNFPLLADVIVTGRSAIQAIESGERQLSCGYTYRLAREGYRWDQRDILGNHVALVTKARAGEVARISDSAPEERPRMNATLKNLVGWGFQLFAKDAKPEEITAALADPEIAAAVNGNGNGNKSVALDSNNNKTPISIRIASDKSVNQLTGKRLVKIGTTEDGVDIFKAVATDDDDDDKKSAKDKEPDEVAKREAMDRRKRMHDQLDAVLDRAATDKATDADIEGLKHSLAKFFSEEENETAHAGQNPPGKDAFPKGHPKGCMCDDCKDARGGSDDGYSTNTNNEEDPHAAKDKVSEEELAEMYDDPDDDDDKKDKTEDADIVRPEPVLEKREEPASALASKSFDEGLLRRAIADGQLFLLKQLKPFIAHSGDRKLIKAYDALRTSLRQTVKGGDGSKGNYKDFLTATKTLNQKATDSKNWKPRESEQEKQQKDMETIYAKTMEERGHPSAKLFGRKAS